MFTVSGLQSGGAELPVAVLFTRERSCYGRFPDVDLYPKSRDALTFPGGMPVVAHPPCRAWGRYRHKAKASVAERDLAFFAIEQVRQNGGVLEHPSGSRLWAEAGLPLPGRAPDRFGGYSLSIEQRWFGHRAIKPTWLYLCGVPCEPARPAWVCAQPIPVEHMGRAERERTPLPLAAWLLAMAREVSAPPPCLNMPIVVSPQECA